MYERACIRIYRVSAQFVFVISDRKPRICVNAAFRFPRIYERIDSRLQAILLPLFGHTISSDPILGHELTPNSHRAHPYRFRILKRLIERRLEQARFKSPTQENKVKNEPHLYIDSYIFIDYNNRKRDINLHLHIFVQTSINMYDIHANYSDNSRNS